MSGDSYFPILIEYQDGNKELAIIHDPVTLGNGRGFKVLRTNFSKEALSRDCSTLELFIRDEYKVKYCGKKFKAHTPNSRVEYRVLGVTLFEHHGSYLRLVIFCDVSAVFMYSKTEDEFDKGFEEIVCIQL